jgi:hypothetical protein
MTKIRLDPSIAKIIDINPVSTAEVVSVYFKGTTNWIGNYGVKVWNSPAKNTEFTIVDAIVVVGDLMTWEINPFNQGLAAHNYYYEISSLTSRRIVFKGGLNIIK